MVSRTTLETVFLLVLVLFLTYFLKLILDRFEKK